MFKSKVKFQGYKKTKTKTNLIFSTKDDFDELDLAEMINDDGFLLFNNKSFNKQVEKVMRDREYGSKVEGKSHSQTIRGLIFSGWSNGFEEFETGEEAYNAVMDQIEVWLRKKYDK